MPYYRQVGEVPRKRHTQFRTPGRRALRRGADGRRGLLLRLLAALPPRPADGDRVGGDVHAAGVRRPRPEPAPAAAATSDPQARRRPGHRRGDRPAAAARQRRRPPARTSPPTRHRRCTATRSATSCVYVEAGSGACETVFGALRGRPGRLRRQLPTSTTHRWVPDGGEPLRLLVTEASGHIGPPRRYLSPRGQFLEHTPVLRARPARAWRAVRSSRARTSRCSCSTRHRQPAGRASRYAHHPFDVVGWDGCLYPYVFSIHDFEPITGRLHQPPPVHQTFEGPNFVVCSFVPRLFDYHPDGIPAPYNHANVDSDEVIFYMGGDFMSRKGAGIELGLDLAAPVRVHPRPAAGVGRGVDRQGRPPRSWPSWSTRSGRSTSRRPGPRRGRRVRLDLGPSLRRDGRRERDDLRLCVSG